MKIYEEKLRKREKIKEKLWKAVRREKEKKN